MPAGHCEVSLACVRGTQCLYSTMAMQTAMAHVLPSPSVCVCVCVRVRAQSINNDSRGSTVARSPSRDCTAVSHSQPRIISAHMMHRVPRQPVDRNLFIRLAAYQLYRDRHVRPHSKRSADQNTFLTITRRIFCKKIKLNYDGYVQLTWKMPLQVSCLVDKNSLVDSYTTQTDVQNSSEIADPTTMFNVIFRCFAIISEPFQLRKETKSPGHIRLLCLHNILWCGVVDVSFLRLQQARNRLF